MAARIMITVITIINSSSVKPIGRRPEAERRFRQDVVSDFCFLLSALSTSPASYFLVLYISSASCRLRLPPVFYQSLYFSPFRAVSFDFERTSKTFSPPHEPLSGES